MGALSALIVGPCVAAPLAGALIYIGQTADALLGGIALFALGMGMGVPLLVIGASAGQFLPRAGAWMNGIKAFFGVGLLGTAIWLLGRVIDPVIELLLWALLLITSSIYMGAMDVLPRSVSGWQRFFKGIGIATMVYGIFMLMGVAQHKTDPLFPLRDTTPVSSPGPQQLGSRIAFSRVGTLQELLSRIDHESKQGHWVMLDFYADWCVSCKEMDRDTFTDSKVSDALRNISLLRVDVTQNSEDDQIILRHFGLIGPPAILFFGPDHEERKNYRVIGFMNPDDFQAHIELVLKSCLQTC